MLKFENRKCRLPPEALNVETQKFRHFPPPEAQMLKFETLYRPKKMAVEPSFYINYYVPTIEANPRLAHATLIRTGVYPCSQPLNVKYFCIR